MKRFLFLSLIVVISLVIVNAAKAQRVVMANYSDTLSGAATKYYPTESLPELFYGGFQVYFDHLTGSTDSTHIWIQGSIDGSNWVNLGSTTVNARTVATNYASTGWDIVCFFTTDATYVWHFSTPLVLPYYRFAVQHYVSSSTVRIKGWAFKKKL